MYKYETHLHTTEGSACATVSGAKLALLYKKAGYDGIIITDHFFRGNSAIPKNLPWSDRINLFCMGYEHAKEVGDNIGLKVFFGYEETFDGTDFLVYGLDKEWMLNHPQMENFTIEQQYNAAKKYGGMVVHAHPFRDRPYIPQIRLYPNHVDAIEVINYSNHNLENQKAFKYAKDYKLPMTCGSDAHHNKVLGGGIATTTPINNIQDYINLIKNNTEYKML